jgi:hypothetical protein
MGGGGIFAGREGRIESIKWWCGDDDEMISFLHSFYKGIFRELERNTHDFLICFALRFLPYSFHFCTDVTLDFLHAFLWTMKQTEEKFWQAWKTFDRKLFGAFWKPRRFLRIVAANFCVWRKNRRSWKCLRQTFALDEKIGGVENVCAKPLRLMKKQAELKMFAPNLCAWSELRQT